MPGHYTKEELDRLDKQALIMLLIYTMGYDL
jgi:hypothetical protein